MTTLINGEYLLNVKAKGFKEINQRVFISSENTEFEYDMISEDIQIPQVTVIAMDIESQTPIKNVFFELFKENMQAPEEGLSDGKG